MPATKKLTHAARVLRIRGMLDSQPFVTIGQLQEEFGVCRRTVYNDLGALGSGLVPIFAEPGVNGEKRWRIERAAQKQSVTLTNGQVMALGLAEQALSFLKGTLYYDELGAILKKMRSGLTPQMRGFLDQLGRKMAIVPYGPKSYSTSAETLDDLVTGLLYDELVEIEYLAANRIKPAVHVIAPLTLVVYRESLYLIAESKTAEARLSFAVDRIVASKRLREKFSYPEDYSPAAFLNGFFGLIGGPETDVEILFDKRQAQYIRERHWHATEEFKYLDDGRLQMRMKVAGTFDVLLWLVGNAATAEVVSPPELRAEVRDLLKAALKRHTDPAKRKSGAAS